MQSTFKLAKVSDGFYTDCFRPLVCYVVFKQKCIEVHVKSVA